MSWRSAALLPLLLLAAPAAAQEGEVKVDQRIIYGDETCPQSTEDTIIVCARKPEEDRYRIPENLRDNPNSAVNRTWTDRAIDLSYAGRTGTDSCSPVGPGGMTGCLTQIINRARADYAQRDEVNWNRLIEEARQERLGRIDAVSEAIERELTGRPE
jgi:hypothetical protein